MPKTHQDAALVAEFTQQADAFAAAPTMRSPQTLEAFLAALPLTPGQRWLDVACGPGIVARALAPRVAEVLGVDLTPAMVARAEAETRAAGCPNARFLTGDATALPVGAAAFDGALTRFSLHHIPAPWRVVAQMARAVRPGGWVAACDHLTCADSRGAAWHLEIERLRDPSHWASLPAESFFDLGRECGLELATRLLAPLEMDFAEWLARGSGGTGARPLIETLLRRAPESARDIFTVRDGHLQLTLGIAVWRKL